MPKAKKKGGEPSAVDAPPPKPPSEPVAAENSHSPADSQPSPADSPVGPISPSHPPSIEPAAAATPSPTTPGLAELATPVAALPELDLSRFADLISLIEETNERTQKKELGRHIRKILARHQLPDYTVVMLVDDVDPIGSYHSNEIYKAASAAAKAKDVLMILSSAGGSIEPGFLLSKTCKRLAKAKFVVAVPRKAKSAATLIALGGDEIHMGMMSELGPIDPQIGGFPALGVQSSLEVVADLVCRYPPSAEMFARYLSLNLDLKHLGYFARVPGSAVQYAERLLAGKTLGQRQTPPLIGKHFVEHYKDHAFVIDVDESKDLLGPMVVQDSKEYAAANEIYQFLDTFGRFLSAVRSRVFWYVGTVENGYGSREIGKD
jgi:hypothetical protein